MTSNCGDGTNKVRPDYTIFYDTLAQRGPDILLVQEPVFVQDEILTKHLFDQAVITEKPYWKFRSALFSNLNVSRPSFLCRPKRPHDVFATCAEVRVGHVPVLVCSVHLRTPLNELKNRKITTFLHMLYGELFGENERYQAVVQLLEYVRSLGYANVIVGGDFNSIPLSRAVRIMKAEFANASSSVLDMFARTSKRKVFGFSPRVDYIFYRGDVQLVSATVLGESSSDHFPVCATFSLPD